jgi:hypothetical protein
LSPGILRDPSSVMTASGDSAHARAEAHPRTGDDPRERPARDPTDHPRIARAPPAGCRVTPADDASPVTNAPAASATTIEGEYVVNYGWFHGNQR